MFKQIALFSTILTWPLLSLGAFVRLKGAGLACPDWPLCYGKIIPPPGFEIALEVGHRFVASLLGICLIALVVLSYLKPHYKHYRTLSWASLILVCIQGILGGLTVLMKLSPPTVVLHLVGGNLLFGLLVYLTYNVYQNERFPRSITTANRWPLSRFSKIQGGMLLLFFIIIISGGANSSTYSGTACTAFPGCHPGSTFSFHSGEMSGDVGSFFPQFRNEWIHMLHRLIAIVGAVGLFVLSWKILYKHPEHQFHLVGIGVWILLLLEILIGMTNAIYHVPVPISASHTAIAATMVGLLSYSFAKSIHEPH